MSLPITYAHCTIADLSHLPVASLYATSSTKNLEMSGMSDNMIKYSLSYYRRKCKKVNIKVHDIDADMPGNCYEWSGYFQVGSYTVKDICYMIMINTYLNFKSLRQVLLNRKD